MLITLLCSPKAKKKRLECSKIIEKKHLVLQFKTQSRSNVKEVCRKTLQQGNHTVTTNDAANVRILNNLHAEFQAKKKRLECSKIIEKKHLVLQFKTQSRSNVKEVCRKTLQQGNHTVTTNDAANVRILNNLHAEFHLKQNT